MTKEKLIRLRVRDGSFGKQLNHAGRNKKRDQRISRRHRRNLSSTQRTSWLLLQPRIDTISVETVTARRYPPHLLSLRRIFETNRTIRRWMFTLRRGCSPSPAMDCECTVTTPRTAGEETSESKEETEREDDDGGDNDGFGDEFRESYHRLNKHYR